MTQTHEIYPRLTNAIIMMIHDAGGIHIYRTEEEVLRLLDECLGAEGIYDEDLQEIDLWIGGMDDETLDTFISGEETDMLAVYETAPDLQGDGSALELINSFYEHCNLGTSDDQK